MFAKRFRYVTGIALLIATHHAFAGDKAIEIGILPVVSTRTLLTTYQPLREYIEEKSGQPVSVVTAPDYRTFIERTQRGEYQFVITAPHLARFAQMDAGYIPIMRLTRELRAIVVVRVDSTIHTLSELRNKRVSTPDATAILTMLGIQLLRDTDLEPGKNVTLQAYPSVNSSALAVLSGDADAAVTAQTALNQMSDEVRAGLRTISTSKSIPHMIYLASSKVPPTEVERITKILLDFQADKTRSKQFFERTGFLGYVQPTAAELKNLDPYVTELKRQLATP